MRKVSDKQKLKNAEWNRITDSLCEELGYVCQYCGMPGQRTGPERWEYLDGHHIVKRSLGGKNEKSNCYPCHRVPCHREIDDKGIIVSIGDYKDRQYFM